MDPVQADTSLDNRRVHTPVPGALKRHRSSVILSQRFFMPVDARMLAWWSGRGPSMDFLAEHFTFLGVEFQYWMPIVVGAAAIYLFYMWKTGRL
jgi:hypothetical protein